jgi:hypothetical protein
MKRNEMHAKRMLTRKNEKSRLKQIKNMTKRIIFILVEMMTSISDPKTEWKNSNDIWNVEQAKKQITKQKDDDDDDIEFIVDTTGDSGLGMTTDDEGLRGQADFVSFDFGDENNVDFKDENNVDLDKRIIISS